MSLSDQYNAGTKRFYFSKIAYDKTTGVVKKKKKLDCIKPKTFISNIFHVVQT